jgi:hypothetical protein
MKFTLALATTCALLSAPAFAQSTTAPHTTLSGTTISTPEFVKKAVVTAQEVLRIKWGAVRR